MKIEYRRNQEDEVDIEKLKMFRSIIQKKRRSKVNKLQFIDDCLI
jgi:hypothetical protein